MVTLDLEMPRMDGMETLRLIMKSAPVPVILFSTHSKEGAYSTFKALALGAVDFVAKPQDAAVGHLDTIADQLIEKIKVAKRAVRHRLPPTIVAGTLPRAKKRAALGDSSKPDHRHRHLHWRPERFAVSAVATSGRFSFFHSDRAAHARRIHRNVCPPPG